MVTDEHARVLKPIEEQYVTGNCTASVILVINYSNRKQKRDQALFENRYHSCKKNKAGL
ncbi:hypothetical protein [Aquibacillus saliphilus]|uniref:hypothetical protein n=1 Tax=Aquibacillus saliphilus TaxID=1909422 RepID=UPI001CF00C4C|nr:hypothetical protein [Aquibacillus saliphilus]